jgi:hypothetical protein
MFEKAASAGGQEEQPCDVNSSTTPCAGPSAWAGENAKAVKNNVAKVKRIIDLLM